MTIILLLLFAYIFGSLPIGLWVGKMVRGIDVREFGSGNIGASNVWRTLGPTWGIIVFLLDVVKGLTPVCWRAIFSRCLRGRLSERHRGDSRS